ncbi:MAG: hypothetical protein EOO22_05865 [Comamonadaceae bacterium]|nr:MAG: hypothetical protein EOO22_05865 [Comamonadaceae bacterium]
MRAAVGTLAWLALALWPFAAGSDTATTAGLGNPATAQLRFAINIDKFLFLGVGGAPWPTESGVMSQLAFTMAPTVPGGPTTPTGPVNNANANWSGGAPTFAVSPAAGLSLPVEVRSNGGTVSLASNSTVLTSAVGGNTTPMGVTITSSNAGLPAPPVVSGSNGGPVSVTPTAFVPYVTTQTAIWTFKYVSPATPPAAGNYTGTITFTATIP